MEDVKYQVAEIFATVQGEGPTTGIPCVFIRLGQCNLSCRWCDTAYTWAYNEKLGVSHKDGVTYNESAELTWMTVAEILSKVKSFNPDPETWRIVVTGGEPLFWNKTLTHLLAALYVENFNIELETNGTIVPCEDVDRYVAQYNTSPKLASSGNSVKQRNRGTSYDWFVRKSSFKPVIFKYVIMTPEDLSEVLYLVREHGIEKKCVYLMPEGRTEQELQDKARWVVELCKEYGFRFCQRVQVTVYGAKRGV